MLQRLVATTVLGLLLLGTFAPLAPAASTAHACCRRKQPHCHAAGNASDTVLRNASCSHQCCRWTPLSRGLFALAVRVQASPLVTSAPLTFTDHVAGPSNSSPDHSGRGPPLASCFDSSRPANQLQGHRREEC